MKKSLLFTFIGMALFFVSCTKSSEQQIKEVLKEIVIEKGRGAISKYEFKSMEIDTLRIKDLTNFVENCFPPKEYPNGVPKDFNDEKFLEFTKPLKNSKSENDIVYLSVKHKYTIFNPILNSNVDIITYRILNPIDYKYVMDDIRKDEFWSAASDYKFQQEMDSLQKFVQQL